MKALAICLFAVTISTLYERIETRIAAQPELAQSLGRPSRELEDLRWLIGEWRVSARVFSAPDQVDRGEGTVTAILGGTWLQFQDRYSGQPEDLGFLTWNVATKRWISIGIDKSGNAITAAGERWEGNRLVLIAENAEIIGERVTLRQTIEKRSAREYRVLNEERLADGTWAAIDEYVYPKQ